MKKTSAILIPLIAAATVSTGQAQLFQNLQTISQSIPVGNGETDPVSGKRKDGPRWVCTGDFDNDGNMDFATCHLNGEIYVTYGRGDGSFHAPRPLASGTSTLRAIVSGDFDKDGRTDLAAAAPYDGMVAVLFSEEGRDFSAPVLVASFQNARNLAGGDFDGDGTLDIAAGGADEWVNPEDPDDPAQVISGVVHLRSRGDRTFERMGTVPEVGLPRLADGHLKPVFSLQSFRNPGDTKDTLAVTHQQSPAIWLLRTGESGVLEVSEALSWFGNGDAIDGSPYRVDSLKIGTLFSQVSTGEMDLLAVMQRM